VPLLEMDDIVEADVTNIPCSRRFLEVATKH
jgi:hypothetical protein